MPQSITPVNELLDLHGKIALVTGASGGIGSAIAQRLAEAGAKVAVHYYTDSDQANAVTDRINKSGGDASTIKADLRLEADCQQLLEHSVVKLGLPDILVNNAGAQPVSSLINMTTTELNDVLSTNIAAPVLLTRLFAAMQKDNALDAGRNASITNIASIEGLQPRAGHSHYASSKAALIMFTRAAALELGQHGIRVNAVSPGLIHRDGLEQDWPEGVNAYAGAAPLGTIGNNTEIANAVLFLSSSAAQWITGSNLVVDGGVSCVPAW